MTRHLKSISACIFVLTLVGCAAPKPVLFQLVDSESKSQKGTIFFENQRIEVVLDGQLYKGFYIFATSEAYSETFGGWRSYPHNSVTTTSSNSARAQLKSESGQRLSCEFLLEDRHAIGTCKTPSGTAFQLIADGN